MPRLELSASLTELDDEVFESNSAPGPSGFVREVGMETLTIAVDGRIIRGVIPYVANRDLTTRN
jgi:hypothetical protein